MTVRRNWRLLFIEAYRNSGNVRAACRAAGVSRSAAYRARETSAKFAKDWDDAREEAIDTLEATAWQRARENSDYLLWKLLQANRRYMYGDVGRLNVDHSGSVGVTFADLAKAAAGDDGG